MAIVERTVENGSRQVICEFWDDFPRAVRMGGVLDPSNPVLPHQRRIFRGQRDRNWRLASVWDRSMIWKQEHGQRVTGQEFVVRDRKLAAFKEYVIGVREIRTGELTSDPDWWTLVRHFGLVTPLLDWTRSPYVAAFFALTDYFEALNPGLAAWGGAETKLPFGDEAIDVAVVYELELTDSIEIGGEFSVVRSRVDIAHRQKAQQGLFTMLTHSSIFDLETYLVSRGLVSLLTRYFIPVGNRNLPRAIVDLMAMNVRYDTLFPDLEGAARQANLDATFGLWASILRLTERRDFPPGPWSTDTKQ